MDAVLFVTAPLALHAQSEFGTRTSTGGLSIGVSFAAGASTSVEAPDLWKAIPILAWRGGIEASYPLSAAISAAISAGLDSRGFELHLHNDWSVWEERRVDYLYVAPGFQFSAFYLGMTIGLPIGGVRCWHTSIVAGDGTVDLDPDTDELVIMVEPRIGAVVPVVDKGIGWLGLTLEAGYTLNDMSKHPEFMPGTLVRPAVSTQTTSIHLGVTWQFGIPGTGER